MIKVYFEVLYTHCELIAVFDDEDTYNACLPALEAIAEERGGIITEGVYEDITMDDVSRKLKEI
jgi:hypothetical protein